jgi:tRNA-dihydrouridine synthase B
MMLHLAPLQGVTNKIYRNAYFRHFGGFDSAIAPFILAVRPLRPQSRHFKDLLPGPAESSGDDAPRPPEGPRSRIRLVPQLIGNDARAFAETARILADMGYSEINWNLGCPFPMVANKLRGSGLLPFPDRIAAVLDLACGIPGIGISVKLRLGRSDPDDIMRLMPVFNDHPLVRVIIHPRVGTQMYSGGPDLEGFARAAAMCRHTLVYNGDITDRAAYDRLAARFAHVHEWMIGRGAVSNPFLAEEIRAGGATGDRASRLRAWHDDLYQSYRGALSGPAHVLDKMKEVWTYLGASLPEAQKRLGRIARASTLQAYEAAVAETIDMYPG